MSIRQSPVPHLQRNGLAEIRDAIQHHCNVIGSDQPPEFFKLLTDVLPAKDPAHRMIMTDDKLMQIAVAVDDEARKAYKVHRNQGYYAPEAISALFNGVLRETRQATADETYSWSGRTRKPSASQQLADELVALAARNFEAGEYGKPDTGEIKRGRAV